MISDDLFYFISFPPSRLVKSLLVSRVFYPKNGWTGLDSR